MTSVDTQARSKMNLVLLRRREGHASTRTGLSFLEGSVSHTAHHGEYLGFDMFYSTEDNFARTGETNCLPFSPGYKR